MTAERGRGSLFAPTSPSDQIRTGNRGFLRCANTYMDKPPMSSGESNSLVRPYGPARAYSCQGRRNPRAGFGFVGPTCKSRAGLRPSPPDQAGLPGHDLQSESTWRLVPAEVARNNVFGSPDRGNRRRSQTALPSDRLGCRDGYPIREVTVRGCWVIVTRLSQDNSADKYVPFHCSHRGHPLHSTDHSLWRCQRTEAQGSFLGTSCAIQSMPF